MICNYCGRVAELVSGREIYPNRPDLHAKLFYACKPCGAWVGTHPRTKDYKHLEGKPLGLLANAEMRKKRHEAHLVFDPLWMRGKMTRQQAYKWLAGKLCIPTAKCHLSQLSLETLDQVIEICQKEIKNVV